MLPTGGPWRLTTNALQGCGTDSAALATARQAASRLHAAVPTGAWGLPPWLGTHGGTGAAGPPATDGAPAPSPPAPAPLPPPQPGGRRRFRVVPGPEGAAAPGRWEWAPGLRLAARWPIPAGPAPGSYIRPRAALTRLAPRLRPAPPLPARQLPAAPVAPRPGWGGCFWARPWHRRPRR